MSGAGGRTAVVFDAAAADALLRARLDAVGNPRPALRAVADVIRAQFAEQFATGRGWPALSARYRARKAARGRGTRTLVDRGLLEASLTRRGARYAREIITGDTVEVRTTDPVASLLRGGTSSMPARDPGRHDPAAVRRRSRDAVLLHLAGGGR